jgi:hypothetical protein
MLAFLAHAAAADPAAPPENLRAAMERQKAELAAVQAKSADGAAALRSWYEASLDAVKKDALGKGNLDGVLATDTERHRLDRDLTPEEKATLPPVLQQVRAQYDQARATMAAQQKTATAALLRTYVTTLEELEKRLTKQADIDGAIATRRERAAAAEELAKPAAPPDPAAIARTAPPVSTPAPTATPAGTKPPSNTGAATAAPVLQVCPKLSASAKVSTTLENVISFTAPPGSPEVTRPGRGVMLKNEPGTGAKGTTWSFELKHGSPASGVQIVHPFGNGHIVIHLREAGLSVLSPADRARAPWEGGDAKKIQLTKGKGVFPLLAGTHVFKIVSQLSAGGRYTFSMGGNVIGTANFSAATPLVLSTDYKGENNAELPTEWPAGAAGLIAGSGGVCECSAVTFQAAAPVSAR